MPRVTLSSTFLRAIYYFSYSIKNICMPYIALALNVVKSVLLQDVIYPPPLYTDTVPY